MQSLQQPIDVDHAKQSRGLTPRRFISGACGIVVLGSTLMLVGWALGTPIFTVLFPGYESVKPNTAGAFIVSALSLWLLATLQPNGPRRFVGILLGWFVSAIGSVTLCQYVSGLDFGIDTLLFHVPPRNLTDLYPARMSIEGAFNFALIGLALVALDRPAIRGIILAEQLTLPPFFVSILAIIGYLYSQQSLYKIGPYTAFSLPSSLLFVILASGIFVARGDRGLMATLTSRSAGGIILRRLLPVAVGTPILIGWVRLRGQELGLYDLGSGLAVFAASTTLLCMVFLWRLASSLNSADLQRTRSETRVRRLLWQAEDREQALRDKQAQLLQAAKLASIGELATGIAHEVNNPLNNIGLLTSNALDYLRLGKPPEVIVPPLEAVVKEVQRAAAIVAGVRSFGRTAPSDFKLVNVNDAIRNALTLISQQLTLHHIQAQLNLPVDPVLLQGNQGQLEQVFLNLFINASDAMEEASERLLAVSMDLSSSTLVIVVRDTGSGIPDSILERIFDPFFTTKPVGQGTGLGLSISYGIIKEHHGDIRVHQEPSGGTSFLISLPACYEHASSMSSFEQQSLLSHSPR
ncbi:MAG TPA: ATP-binding protein [Nitrospiraceae bacterium]|nr:ATP-binding protein [Nitrospiraceae bacterium]